MKSTAQHPFRAAAAHAALALALCVSACSGAGGSDGTPPPSGQPSIELLAGAIGGFGNVDGVGAAARFAGPSGIASDSAGNLYVADTGNSTIRKIDANANVTTLAGSPQQQGSADGAGSAARFGQPWGIAADGAGNLYVTDTLNLSVRRITRDGVVTTVAGGSGRGSVDGPGSAAQFNQLEGIAVDSTGNLYVADSNNYTVRKISRDGVVSTLAGVPGQAGSADGIGASARFQYPTAVAADAAGNVYVSDYHTVRLITPLGAVSTLAGNPAAFGHQDGPGAQATFSPLAGVTLDPSGNVYVLEFINGVTDIRKIAPDGNVSTVTGTLGPGLKALAWHGTTLAAADQYDSVVQVLDPSGAMRTIAGFASEGRVLDGTGAAARFGYIPSIVADAVGDLVVPDTTITGSVRRITPDGVVSTFFTDASLHEPSGATTAAMDGAGNIYLGWVQCDNRFGFCRGVIRKLSPAGALSIVVPMTYNDAAATPVVPTALATDGAGNLYVADAYNCVVRKITPAGEFTILAGRPTPLCIGVGEADGIGPAAGFRYPAGIAVDSSGNVYVTDFQGQTVRRITSAGVVTTLAGTADASGDADGTGPAARFSQPMGIAVDDGGNVYVADSGNYLVRKIAPGGVVTTVAGTRGRIGFNPGPLPGVLNSPFGLALYGSNLYVTMQGGVAVIRNRP